MSGGRLCLFLRLFRRLRLLALLPAMLLLGVRGVRGALETVLELHQSFQVALRDVAQMVADIAGDRCADHDLGTRLLLLGRLFWLGGLYGLYGLLFELGFFRGGGHTSSV